MTFSWKIAAALLALPFAAQSGPMIPSASQDSVAQAAAEPKVEAQSTFEKAVNLPGTLLYLPVHFLFWGVEHGYAFVFDEKAWERLKRLLTTEDGKIGVRPVANSLNGPGVRLFVYQKVLNSNINLTSQVGSLPKSNASLTLSWPGGRLIPGGKTVLAAELDVRTSKRFWGTGNSTTEQEATVFGTSNLFTRAAYSKKTGRYLRLGSELSYSSYGIGSPEDHRLATIADTVMGADERNDFFQAAVSARISTVDKEGSPTRGSRTFLRLALNQSVNTNRFRHAALTFRTSRFLELFYKRTASIEAGFDWRIKGPKEIPFYHLASLGGESVLRGYRRDRFRDIGSVFTVISYKFPVWRAIDGIVFYERGRVFGGIDELTFDGWKYSFGGGLNFWTKNGRVFQLVLAHSKESALRVIFNLNVGT